MGVEQSVEARDGRAPVEKFLKIFMRINVLAYPQLAAAGRSDRSHRDLFGLKKGRKAFFI